jgi:hypothetical protein
MIKNEVKAIDQIVFGADLIQECIQQQVTDHVKRRMAELEKELAFKVPEIVAGISILLMKQVSMKVIGDELIIRIIMPEKTP